MIRNQMPSNECHWISLMISQKLVQVMVWCNQTASHYLSKCWPWFASPHGITRLQWVKRWVQLQAVYCGIVFFYTIGICSFSLWIIYICFKWHIYTQKSQYIQGSSEVPYIFFPITQFNVHFWNIWLIFHDVVNIDIKYIWYIFNIM